MEGMGPSEDADEAAKYLLEMDNSLKIPFCNYLNYINYINLFHVFIKYYRKYLLCS